MKIGADYVITPQIITGQRLFSYVIKPDAANFMDDVVYSDETDIGLEELEVNENSWMAGLPIKDLNLREYGLMVIAIKRGKEVITQVRGDSLINGGDNLLMRGIVSAEILATSLVADLHLLPALYVFFVLQSVTSAQGLALGAAVANVISMIFVIIDITKIEED